MWTEITDFEKSMAKIWPEVMDENAEVTESDTVYDELEDVLDCLSLVNSISWMNQEEIKVWIEVDFDESIKTILADEAMTQRVINLTNSKDVDFDEDGVDKTKNIRKNQTADALIKFSDHRR